MNSLSHIPQRYFPFFLIAVTILIGIGLLIQKGYLTLPNFGKKSTVIDVKKTSVVELLYTGSEYKLSYADMPAKESVSIAKFDKTEQWQGAGSIEEGQTRDDVFLTLVDRDRQKVIAYLNKNMNLSGVDTIKLSVNLKSNPDNIEAFNLLLGNKDMSSYFRFPVTNMKEGENNLTIPKYRFFLAEDSKEGSSRTISSSEALAKPQITWETIERIQLELISRPTAKSTVDVGWIWAEKEDVFESDWNWTGDTHFFNLDHTSDGKTTLLANNIGGSVATLKKLGSVKDFSYSAKITSLKKGQIGLFFRGDYITGYGYYLAVGGLGTNDWSVSKYHVSNQQPITTVLFNGKISNFEFSKDQPFWLKVSTKGNQIKAYFSLDGKDWTPLGEDNDNEFGAGGVGLAISEGGRGYFDDFQLTK